MTARRADIADLPAWPRLLSREQAAAYMGVSVATLAGLAITSVKVGGRRLYDRHVLDNWVDRLTQAGDDGDDADAALERLA